MRLIRLKPDGVTGPLSIGNPDEFSTAEQAELVIRGTSNISHAESQIGWQPTVQVGEGLKRTLAYFWAGGVSSR